MPRSCVVTHRSCWLQEASQQQPATPVQTWLGWGASYFTGYFSYLPQIEGHSSIPTDAAIKELSNMLEQVNTAIQSSTITVQSPIALCLPLGQSLPTSELICCACTRRRF